MNDGSEVKRITTGVAELDGLLYGGLPEGSQTVIIGQPGTGKSILAFQILYSNARKGIPCTVILLDQRKEDFIKNATSAFSGFKDVQELIDKKLLNIAENTTEDKFTSREAIMSFIARTINLAQANNSKIVAMDELSLLRALLDDDREFTRTLNYIAENFHLIGVTGVVTMELPDSNSDTQIPGLYEESMFDGVIRLANIVNGEETRHVCAIAKMRYSRYKSTSTTLEITPEGIVMTPIK